MTQEVNEKLNCLFQKEDFAEDLKSIYCEPDHTEEVTVESYAESLKEVTHFINSTTEENFKIEANNENVELKNNFKCPICAKRYQKIVSYKIHRMCHVELYCDVCHEVFDNEIEKQHHTCRVLPKHDQELITSSSSNSNKLKIEINLNRLGKNIYLYSVRKHTE